MNFLYRMKSEAVSPIGIMSTGDWFERFKTDPDDELFVPVIASSSLDPTLLRKEDLDALSAEGSHGQHRLWFAMDDRVIGCATFLRIFEDVLNARWEFWYTHFTPITPSRTVLPEDGPVIDELVAKWQA